MNNLQIAIELDQMRFYAYHGVLEQEKRVGNHFVVSLRMHVEVDASLESDALADTISYAEVYEWVEREMNTPSQLLEHVVGRIANTLFARFIAIKHLTVRLTKLNPPFRGDVASASVELSADR